MKEQRVIYHAFVNGIPTGGEISYTQIAKVEECLKYITDKLKYNPDSNVYVDSIKVTYHNSDGSVRTKRKGLFETKMLRYIYRRKINYSRLAHQCV